MFETFDLYEELIKKGYVPTLFLRFEKRTKVVVLGLTSAGDELREVKELRILQQLWIEANTEKKHWVDVKEVQKLNDDPQTGKFDVMKFK